MNKQQLLSIALAIFACFSAKMQAQDDNVASIEAALMADKADQHRLFVNGEEWSTENMYISPVDLKENVVEIVAGNPLSTIIIGDASYTGGATYIVKMPKPGFAQLEYSIADESGANAKKYTLNIEQYFDFSTLVKVKWNNTLMINLNYLADNGYVVSAYQWYKDGVAIKGAAASVYSAGSQHDQLLEKDVVYSVGLITEDGILSSTGQVLNLEDSGFRAFLNQQGGLVYFETNLNQQDLVGSTLDIYNITGVKESIHEVSGSITPLSLAPGTYVIIFKTVVNVGKELKFIVK